VAGDYLPIADVLDLVAFGPTKLAMGLSDIDEHAKQLRAGIAIINAAMESRIKHPSHGIRRARGYIPARIRDRRRRRAISGTCSSIRSEDLSGIGKSGRLRLVGSPDGRDGSIVIHQDTDIPTMRC
jgi:hypothetical protein